MIEHVVRRGLQHASSMNMVKRAIEEGPKITVSTPQEPAPASKDDKEGLLESAPTITLVHQKPITSSIRGTIRHLVSEAGRLARFRGFKSYALWALCISVVTNVQQPGSGS